MYACDCVMVDEVDLNTHIHTRTRTRLTAVFAMFVCIYMYSLCIIYLFTLDRCHLPVHQDGSCNGLQHYAALGRDKPGGLAVNLLPSDRPQDVYSEVLNLALQAIDRDVLISPDEEDLQLRKKGINARLIHGHVNRKVIKQTVMTSVYGVTLTGARLQIMGKLKDKIYGDDMINRQIDDELFSASRYIAACFLPFALIGQVYDQIMNLILIIHSLTVLLTHSLTVLLVCVMLFCWCFLAIWHI